MSKTGFKMERICKHGIYEVVKMEDQRFGGWQYGLFCNGQWREWSWDCNALIKKAYADERVILCV